VSLPTVFGGRLRLPAMASPLFLTSGPDLVVEVCRSGLIGTFPALNQRTSEGFSSWISNISERLSASPAAAPFGVNVIVHKSNTRLAADLRIVIAHKVALIITSLGLVREVVDMVHSYGGLIFQDVINVRHAEKATEAGVDGIIAVCAGAGGHTGTLSPFALIHEIKSFFNGTIVLAGSISTGQQIAAARLMGADLAYLGTRFIATREAMADPRYKHMILSATAADILYTDKISGLSANFLRPSIVLNGMDPENLPQYECLDSERRAKAWKTLWSAGHGVGAIDVILPAADLCERLITEYRDAMKAAQQDEFASPGHRSQPQ
jgi:nitronate monooxygenase